MNERTERGCALGGENKHERLRSARIKAGFRSAAAAADSLGIPHSTYQAHENGNRSYDSDDAARYARKYRVTADWLLFGNGSADQLADTLNQDQAWENIDLAGSPFDDIELFQEAYREAQEFEKAKTGGRGRTLPFAMMVWAIYDLKKSDRSRTD